MNRLLWCITIGIVELSILIGQCLAAPEHYPEFSWDRVPVYMMFADDSRVLLDSEVKKIASESDFICIEKHHGIHTFGDAALGLKHENRAFKKVKPGIKVLGYLNSAHTYPFTRYTKMFKPGIIDEYPEMKAYLITDPKTGEPVVPRSTYGFNVLNPDMRAWWSDSAADMVRESGADGIFIDQMHGFVWLHGREKSKEVKAGVADMLRQLKEKMGPGKILLANNGAHIPEVFEIADAFMFEHYKREATHTKEKLLEDWQLMEKIAAAGKICVYRFGAEAEPGGGTGRTGSETTDWAALSKKQLPFHLAVYLTGAQPYSYFQWGWGWGLKTGPLEHYPEFHKPLGKPLGRYKRVHPGGWEFTREFEHASVWVDLEKREGRIDWK